MILTRDIPHSMQSNAFIKRNIEEYAWKSQAKFEEKKVKINWKQVFVWNIPHNLKVDEIFLSFTHYYRLVVWYTKSESTCSLRPAITVMQIDAEINFEHEQKLQLPYLNWFWAMVIRIIDLWISNHFGQFKHFQSVIRLSKLSILLSNLLVHVGTGTLHSGLKCIATIGTVNKFPWNNDYRIFVWKSILTSKAVYNSYQSDTLICYLFDDLKKINMSQYFTEISESHSFAFCCFSYFYLYFLEGGHVYYALHFKFSI